jgi:hypothetical protein
VWRAGAAVVVGVLVVCASTVAALGDNTPPPNFQKAVQMCAAQGLTQGTDAFAKCVSQTLQQLNAAPGTAGNPTGNVPAGLQQAIQTCLNQGNKPNTPAMNSCVNAIMGSSPGAPQPTSAAGKAAQQCIAQGLKPNTPDLNACVSRLLMSPKQQAAYDACVAKGLTPNTQAFTQCTSDQMGVGANNPPLTAQQQDDVAYCLGLGKVQGTPDFAACIKTAGNRNLTAKQQAAVDTCQAKGLSGTALGDCVSALLTTSVPAPSGSAPPYTSDQIQAAMAACFKKGFKPGTTNFAGCVKTTLANG